VGVAQEVPKLPAGRHGAGKAQGQQHGDKECKALSWHGQYS
jgi:hypothetical protein